MVDVIDSHPRRNGTSESLPYQSMDVILPFVDSHLEIAVTIVVRGEFSVRFPRIHSTISADEVSVASGNRVVAFSANSDMHLHIVEGVVLLIRLQWSGSCFDCFGCFNCFDCFGCFGCNRAVVICVAHLLRRIKNHQNFGTS